MLSAEVLIQEIKYWQEITMTQTYVWLPGEITEVTDPVSYKVRIDRDGKIFRRHQDQLRKGCTVSELSSQAELSTQDDYIFPSAVSNDNIEPSTPKTAPVRKSTRIRKPIDRLVL